MIAGDAALQNRLRGSERVFLGRTAKASGDILTRRIAIEDGAVFTGRVEVVRPEEAPAASAPAANTTGQDSARAIVARAQSDPP